jgi:hypothetical protein
MDLAWRIALAAIGLFLLRGVLYAPQWGHGGGMRRLVGTVICTALAWPLLSANPTSRWLLPSIAAVWLFPVQPIAFALFQRAVFIGARRTALSWGAPLTRTGDLWEVVQGNRDRWMGNVLTRVRSLHPGVRTGKTYYMMAFSLKLASPPPVLFSITRGWASPKYFTSEWRETTVMQGEFVGLSLGPVMNEGGVATGGVLSSLAPVEPPDARLGGFNAFLASDAAAFRTFFAGEVVDKFLRAASFTLQFEMNVTPTTANIYTTYCGPAAQAAMLEVLEFLHARCTP